MPQQPGNRSPYTDLLEAIRMLEPADDRGLRAIAEMLGLQWDRADLPVRTPRPPGTDPTRAPARARIRREPTERDTAPAPSARKPIESRLESLTPEPSAPPAWLGRVAHLPRAEHRATSGPLPHVPLLRPQAARAILSGALSTLAPSHAIDLAEVVRRVSRAERIDRVPRVPVATLARGVQLLLDRSEGMQPFAPDQAALRARVLDVVGRDRTSVLSFAGSPLWGAGTGARDEWSDWRPPLPGTPVLALTDLGIARPGAGAERASPADWLEVARVLERAGCPLVALVPYAKRRWPPLLRARLTVIEWDRGTTARAVRAAIGPGLRPRGAAV